MRVVGGVWRGRRLVAPRGAATRPTSDIVREAVFNVLTAALAGRPAPERHEQSVAPEASDETPVMGLLQGMVVLDLFAGSVSLECPAIV